MMSSPTPTIFGIAFALLAAASAAGAQDRDLDEAIDSDAGSARNLDTVTVTAQLREQDASRVPLAVSVLDADQLDAYGSAAQDVLSIAGRAPSLYGESSFGRTFPRFYIRGLGNSDFDLNASQPVSLVYDGVVQENPTLKGFPIFDLDRIEVLRGPQGTLFGRNTPGGVVKFESLRPSFQPGGYLKLGYGRFGTVNVEGAAGGQVGPDSALRVSALYQHRDNFSDNSVLGDGREGFTDRAVRAQWLYRPGDVFEALLNVHARQLDGGSQVYRANSIVFGGNAQPPGFGRFRLDQDARPAAYVDTLGGIARLQWTLDRLRVVSISGYESLDSFARGDVDGGFGAVFAPPSGPGAIPFAAESGDGIPDHHQVTQELRVESTGDGRSDWQAGLYFFDESLRIDNYSYDTLDGSTQNGYARQRQRNRAYAAFVAGGYRFADAWRLGGGLRYTRDDKDFYAERLQTPFGGANLPRIETSPSDGNLSGDLSLTWDASDTVTAHARVASGFRAPSIQGRVLFGDQISVANSETILSYELGANVDLFDHRARASFNLFRYRLDDAQLTAVGGGANFNRLVNADRVIGQGAELEIQALLGDRFDFNAGVSYNDTRIRDPNLAVQSCAASCTVLDREVIPGLGIVSIDGNPLPQAPRWIGYLFATYTQPLAGGEWYAQGDWSYHSEVDFFLYRSREFTGPALSQVGLRSGYRWGRDRYEVALLGRNIFDRIVAIGGVDFNNLTGFYNQPRYWGVEFVTRY